MSRRALIIDKDAIFANRLAGELGAHGFEVEKRATGREGMDAAKSISPDLIVLCVELDDTSGYSICAKMKKDPGLKEIPLVITSEKATQGTFDHHKKLKTRAQHYFMKPFEPSALLAELGLGGGQANGVYGGPHSGPAIDVLSPSPYEDEGIDTGAQLDEALASLSDETPPLPEDLGVDAAAAIPDSFDQDDIRTTIGEVPSSVVPLPESAPISSGSSELAASELLRRLKAAERARDEAVAAERATQAQLQALSAGASQLPAATSASRDVLAVKKELNAKERELLELREALQERDKQLLGARERHAELEEQIVQAEESRDNAERARVEAEGRIAGAEARADEIQRSSTAAIDERDQQIEELSGRGRELEGSLEAAKTEGAERARVIEEREAELARLHGELESTSGTLEVSRGELETARRHIDDLDGQITAARGDAERLQAELSRERETNEGLTSRGDALERDLEDVRGEADALRGALADTEDRLAQASQRIREDEDIRAKAKQALQITLNLLSEADGGEEIPDSVSDPGHVEA
ncbi:MAG: response regulator [Myxococcota bacterium]